MHQPFDVCTPIAIQIRVHPPQCISSRILVLFCTNLMSIRPLMHQPSYFFAIPFSVHPPLNAWTLLFFALFLPFQSMPTRPLMHQPSYFCTFLPFQSMSTLPLMHQLSNFCTFFAIPVCVHPPLNASTLLFLDFFPQFQSVCTRILTPYDGQPRWDSNLRTPAWESLSIPCSTTVLRTLTLDAS